MGFELHPHQVKAVADLKNGAILAGGVGTGKTLTSLGYYVERICGGKVDRSVPVKQPVKLVVITTAFKRNKKDWEDDALKMGIFVQPELSYTKSEFVVDSWNNIKKYEDVEGAFFIFDEQKLVGNGVWVKTFLKLAKKNQWILLSATPADTWLDYVPVFIANGFYANRTRFVENHVVWSFHGKYRTIRGFYGVRYLESLRDRILVEMPFERHTQRHVIVTDVEFDQGKFDSVWRRKWNVFEECPIMDSGEMHRLARRVVNSDPSRAETITRLLEKHDKMIVFYSFDYELELLREIDVPGVVVAEYNGHKHQPIPDSDRWLYLVQYLAGAEGWNCTETDTVLYYSLDYSHKRFEQTQGRIDRLNTPFNDLWYYVLKSGSKIDNKIWKAIESKKDFHEGRLVKF